MTIDLDAVGLSQLIGNRHIADPSIILSKGKPAMSTVINTDVPQKSRKLSHVAADFLRNPFVILGIAALSLLIVLLTIILSAAVLGYIVTGGHESRSSQRQREISQNRETAARVWLKE